MTGHVVVNDYVKYVPPLTGIGKVFGIFSADYIHYLVVSNESVVKTTLAVGVGNSAVPGGILTECVEPVFLYL